MTDRTKPVLTPRDEVNAAPPEFRQAMIAAMTKREAFDPEGEDYDYESAKKAGITPDETGHWQSRDPKTGLILKGRKHPTFHKTLEADAKLGYKIIKGKDGRYYSIKDDEAEAFEAEANTILKSK